MAAISQARLLFAIRREERARAIRKLRNFGDKHRDNRNAIESKEGGETQIKG